MFILILYFVYDVDNNNNNKLHVAYVYANVFYFSVRVCLSHREVVSRYGKSVAYLLWTSGRCPLRKPVNIVSWHERGMTSSDHCHSVILSTVSRHVGEC